MQRARRTAILAVLTLAGALALTGCRSEPGVAVYIANTEYSQDRVEGLAQQFSSAVGVRQAQGVQEVISWIVASEVGKRMTAAEKWQAPQVDTESVTGSFREALLQRAQQEAGAAAAPGQNEAPDADTSRRVNERLESMRPLIQLYAEFMAYVGVVQQHVTPAQPTDADYSELYRRAKAAGMIENGQTEAQYRQAFGPQNEQVFAANIGLRNKFVEAIERENVAVNPLYAPAEMTLLRNSENRPLVVIPLDARGGSAPVRAS